jgi:hypothetical protein
VVSGPGFTISFKPAKLLGLVLPIFVKTGKTGRFSGQNLKFDEPKPVSRFDRFSG